VICGVRVMAASVPGSHTSAGGVLVAHTGFEALNTSESNNLQVRCARFVPVHVSSTVHAAILGIEHGLASVGLGLACLAFDRREVPYGAESIEARVRYRDKPFSRCVLYRRMHWRIER